MFSRGPDNSFWKAHAGGLWSWHFDCTPSYLITVLWQWNLTESLVSIYISSVTRDVECVSWYVCAICGLSLVEYIVSSSQYFNGFINVELRVLSSVLLNVWLAHASSLSVACLFILLTWLLSRVLFKCRALYQFFWGGNQVFIVNNSFPDVASSRVLPMFYS